MKLEILKSIISKKQSKSEFAIVTNLGNGESEIFEKDKLLSKKFEKYSNQINDFFNSKKNGIIEGTEIFIETYIRPIKVIIVGAVHIAQYLTDFAKSLNFEISIIDPRGYFASEKRFPGIKIINEWPEKAFDKVKKTLFSSQNLDQLTTSIKLINNFNKVYKVKENSPEHDYFVKMIDIIKFRLEKINFICSFCVILTCSLYF